MKYIVPSSKIVLGDFMLLLVSLLMGLNSVMSFSEETKLPPVNLPNTAGAEETGYTDIIKTVITIRSSATENRYFFNNREVKLWELIKLIRLSQSPAVLIRADQKTHFVWQEFFHLTSELTKAGVKEISYASALKGGKQQ